MCQPLVLSQIPTILGLSQAKAKILIQVNHRGNRDVSA